MSVTEKDKPQSHPVSPNGKRPRSTPEKKFQIFLEAQRKDAAVGEILRREGIYSTDLARIQRKVKEGALESLSEGPGRKKAMVSLEAYEALKKDLEEGEGPGGIGCGSLHPSKKNQWGFLGKIERTWIEEEQKLAIVEVVKDAKEKGISKSRACALWRIERRRVVRWSSQWQKQGSLANRKPGPKSPVHRLLMEESEAVIRMAKDESYADLSHRSLAVTAWDKELFFISFSSVYRILRSVGLMTMRGYHRHHHGRSVAPVRKELSGPNQRWCWDISYLHTYERGVFLFLYLFLDEFSRKVISWRVSWHQTALEAQNLLEAGLIAENILDLPEEKRPEIFNDRGRQMKAHCIRTIFSLHAMPQVFTRPRTPNDNPFVESAFATIKTTPHYPGRFLDLNRATDYFKQYFWWYDNVHLHSCIDYVTPMQCHLGLREQIVAERRAKLDQQRRLRRQVNQGQRGGFSLTVPTGSSYHQPCTL